MHIDRHNFNQTIEEILSNIQRSDFVSFDCQFSGLVATLDKIQGIFPNHIQFYQRIKETANNFALFQVGISAFVFHNDQYHPKVYNFYLEPRMISSNPYNKVILCEVESIQFLAKNNMDFKRIFTSGIKSKRLINSKEQQLHNNKPFKQNHHSMYFQENDKKVIEEIQNKIKTLISNQNVEIVDFKSKSILLYFRNKYSNLAINDRTKNMKQYEFAVRKQEGEMKQQKQQQNKPEQYNYMGNQQKQLKYGFEIVIQKIIENKKPIIGHFPNLDIGLIYSHYIDQLPQSYEKFCEAINNYFPYIFDTKVISRRIQNKLRGLRIDLASLFKACFAQKLLKPFTNINYNEQSKYIKQQSQHEAGYDAFITGCSFVGMVNYMLQQKDQRINFNYLEEINKILYSRFTGEVGLCGPLYCASAIGYDRTIIVGQILPEGEAEKVSQILAKFGSLCVYEDHGQTYYVFEKEQNIDEIIYLYPALKFLPYSKRNIIKASRIFTSKQLKGQ